MGIENKSLNAIKEHFAIKGKTPPNMFWQHGCLWVDTEDKLDLARIKKAMLEDVLPIKYTVEFSELRATNTEPWTQWAMDIVAQDLSLVRVQRMGPA